VNSRYNLITDGNTVWKYI